MCRETDEHSDRLLFYKVSGGARILGSCRWAYCVGNTAMCRTAVSGSQLCGQHSYVDAGPRPAGSRQRPRSRLNPISRHLSLPAGAHA